jgi:glycosyltransferase involved in cell wall biosynthesis
LKIAVNTRFLLKNKLEGIGRVTHEVLRRMVQNHPEDEFIFFFDRAYDEEFIYGKNVTPVVLFPPTRHPILIVSWFEFSVKRALEKYQPDVFFSTDGFCSLRSEVKTVVLVHDIAYKHFPDQVSFFIRKFYQNFQHRYLQKADQVLTVSHFVKNDLVDKIGIPARKIQVAHNGCSSNFSPSDDLTKKKIREKYTNGQPYFFYVGAVHPRKNVHGLISAFDIFKEKTNAPHQLLIGGRFAWQTGEVKTAYDNAKHQKDIQFLGFVEEEELPKLIGSAFAFVYVSFFEGFGLPLLEAMECEVPLITSNISSMPEVAEDAAILVNPHDVNEIVNAMLQYFENEDLRQEKIQNGRLQKEKFNWNKSAEIMYDILSK